MADMMTTQLRDLKARHADASRRTPETVELHHREARQEIIDRDRHHKQAETTEWMSGDDSAHPRQEDFLDKIIWLQKRMEETPRRRPGGHRHQSIQAGYHKSTTDLVDLLRAIHMTLANLTVHDLLVQPHQSHESATIQMIGITYRTTHLRATRIELKIRQHRERRLLVPQGIVFHLRA